MVRWRGVAGNGRIRTRSTLDPVQALDQAARKAKAMGVPFEVWGHVPGRDGETHTLGARIDMVGEVTWMSDILRRYVDHPTSTPTTQSLAQRGGEPSIRPLVSVTVSDSFTFSVGKNKVRSG